MLPVHAPIAGYTRPAPPPHQLYEQQMEQASARLLAAITRAQLGRDPGTPAKLIWLMPVGGKEPRVTEWQRPADPVPTDRDPCERCNVRADLHAEHGCASYSARLRT